MSQCRPSTAALRRLFDRELGKTLRVPVKSCGTEWTVRRTEHFAEVILAAPGEPGAIVEPTMAGHDGWGKDVAGARTDQSAIQDWASDQI